MSVILDDIMTFTDAVDNKGKIIIIDGHNIAYITVFSTIANDYSDNGVFKLWRHNFLNKVFYTIRELEPTKVVLAFDSKNSWRYDLYPDYKGNRKKQYGKYPLDKKNFNLAIDSMVNDMKKIFPNIYTIQSPRAEGDDIMAILATHVFNKDGQEVVIVSGDTDLNQLTSRKNVTQYNPRKNEFYNVLNPKRELDIKILSGDKSDNIKPIKRGVGVKTAEKILIEGIDPFIEKQSTELERKTIKENFERNTQLIDLKFIPIELKDTIIDEYENYPYRELKGKSVIDYFTKNKMKRLYREWNRMSKYLKKLS